MRSRSRTVLPSAARLMASLRDMGYSTEAAVADLVDNSIDAGATVVDVDLEFEGEYSWLRVADNGRGMTAPELEEAMRYGTRRTYDEVALGRFGLGLKTASLSQCRRLTVASRVAPVRARIHAAAWDLDHVERTDEWALFQLGAADLDDRVLTRLSGGPGTVVLWDDLDRVLGYRDPSSGMAARGLQLLAESIAEHLGMVFHRFISGSAARNSPLELRVNGVPVAPWDPFCTTEIGTRRLAPQRLVIEGDERRGSVSVQPYILPAQARFSTPEAHARAGGPRRWNRQQGLYIYIRDRLVQSGGWSRLRAEDEHTKLARIAIDVPSELEAAFAINVSKMRVTLPPGLRKPLQALVSGVTSRARDAYHAHVTDMGAVAETPATDDADYVVVSDDILTVEQVATALVGELGGNPELLRRVLRRLGLDILAERPAGAVDVDIARRA